MQIVPRGGEAVEGGKAMSHPTPKMLRRAAILRGIARVLRSTSRSRGWLTRLAKDCGELDGAQWQKEAAAELRGLADQCVKNAELVERGEKPPKGGAR
jgi:hypothetical protein